VGACKPRLRILKICYVVPGSRSPRAVGGSDRRDDSRGFSSGGLLTVPEHRGGADNAAANWRHSSMTSTSGEPHLPVISARNAHQHLARRSNGGVWNLGVPIVPHSRVGSATGFLDCLSTVSEVCTRNPLPRAQAGTRHGVRAKASVVSCCSSRYRRTIRIRGSSQGVTNGAMPLITSQSG